MCSNRNHFLNSYLAKGKGSVLPYVARCVQAMSILVFVSVASDRFLSKWDEIKEAQEKCPNRVQERDILLIKKRIKFIFGRQENQSKRFLDGMRLDCLLKALIGSVIKPRFLTFREADKSENHFQAKKLEERIDRLEKKIFKLSEFLEALYSSYMRKAKVGSQDVLRQSYARLKKEISEISSLNLNSKKPSLKAPPATSGTGNLENKEDEDSKSVAVGKETNLETGNRKKRINSNQGKEKSKKNRTSELSGGDEAAEDPQTVE